jgi:hypothetical protein
MLEVGGVQGVLGSLSLTKHSVGFEDVRILQGDESSSADLAQNDGPVWEDLIWSEKHFRMTLQHLSECGRSAIRRRLRH